MKMRLLILVFLAQSHLLFGNAPAARPRAAAAASASSARPRAAAAAALYADEQNNPKEDVEEGYAQELLTSAFPDLFRPAEPSYEAVPAFASPILPSLERVEATEDRPAAAAVARAPYYYGAPAAAAAGSDMAVQAQQNQPARANAAAAAGAGAGRARPKAARVGAERGKAKSIGEKSQANTYKVGKGRYVVRFLSNNLLAVLNVRSNSVSMFTIDRQTGQLLEAKGSPYPVGMEPNSLSFSTARNVLAISSSSAIDIFVVDKNTGALHPIKNSPFDAKALFGGDNHYSSLSISQEGDRIYISRAIAMSKNLGVFAIDYDKGALIAASLGMIDAFNPQISFSPYGNVFVYTDGVHRKAYIFAIDRKTGIMQPVAGSPFSIGEAPTQPQYNAPTDILFSADGTLLIVIDEQSKRVNMFTIDNSTNTVAMKASQPLPFKLNLAYHDVSLSANGRLLAVGLELTRSGRMALFTIDKKTGSLKAFKGSPFEIGRVGGISLSPDGRLLAVARSSGRQGIVSMYEIDIENETIQLITGKPLKVVEEQKQLKESLIDTAKFPQDIVKGPLFDYLYGPEHVEAKPISVKETREEIRERDAQRNLALTQQQRANQENDKRALFKSIAEANIIGVEQYLTPFTVNAKADEDNRTPLMRAVSWRVMPPERVAIARKILNYVGFKYHTLYKEQAEEVKPNLELTDNFGNTALKLAEIHGHIVLADEIKKKMATNNPSVGGKRKR